MRHSIWLRILILGTAALAITGCDRRTAEEKGQDLAGEKLDLVKGIGGALESKGGATGETLSKGAGETLLGLARGFEDSFGRKIASSPGLEKAGVKVSRVQDAKGTAEKLVHGIDAYVVAERNVLGKLQMVAFDRANNEIARASVPIKMEAGDALYQSIELDERVVLADITKIVFDIRPDPAAAAAATQQ
jgi:hypothetical protein